jgi:hypothetical protein
MVDTWNETFDEEELECLQEGRQYIIFKPNPEDENTFSVKIADTTPEEEKSSGSLEESSSNISVLVVKGIMYMMDNELEYLVESGAEALNKEYLLFKREKFKDSSNVLVFDPSKEKH